MKAEELMIGDLVQVEPSGMAIRIGTIHKKEVGYHTCQNRISFVKEELLNPIPLTPEILKKSGFVLKPDGWLWCEYAEIEDKNYIFIQFRKGCEEVRLVELNFVNRVLARYEQMHYVHELQHALRLCGIEKEIEL